MSAKFDTATKHFACRQVLIVDDQFVMRELIAGICEGIGFQNVATCNSGKEAIRELQNGKFDLVIIDELLEGERGSNLIRAIRSIDALSAVRLILVTASRDYQIAIYSKKIGCDDFMLKPFDPKTLKERLLRLFPDFM